jgi:hypothetical protein
MSSGFSVETSQYRVARTVMDRAIEMPRNSCEALCKRPSEYSLLSMLTQSASAATGPQAVAEQGAYQFPEKRPLDILDNCVYVLDG